jgi:CheY-like chemotaxis protein
MANILVIDDDPLIGELITAFLRAEGHAVDRACGGIADLQAFQEGNYDLVCTDLQMPDVGGWEVAQEVKKRPANLPVLLITGNVVEEEELAERRVDRILCKPVRRQALCEAVQQLLEPARGAVRQSES